MAENSTAITDEIAPGSALASETSSGSASDGFWDLIWEALRCSHRDFTTGPIGRSLLILAIPMVLEMCMESVFAVVDMFWVSHLGTDAMATVGITVSLLFAVIGVSFSGKLLAVMGGSPGVVSQGAGFTKVMFAGNASILLLFLINAIFRGAGDAAIAMRVLWLANSINILLGPCLIFGLGPFPKLGVVGAAVATTIGRSTGVIYAFSRLIRAGGRFDILKRHLKLEPAIMLRLIRLSATGTFQVFIGMASWIGLMRIVSSFGSDAVAGYVAGIRVILFALLPSFGMSNAAATMVGQALGAKKPDRAEQAVWKAGFYSMIFLGIVGLVFVLFARQIISLYGSDPKVIPYGADCLRIVAYGFLFYAYGMVLTQSFNGAGDTRTPTVINLFVFWLWELPLGYVLAIVFGLGLRGVFIAF